MPSYLAAMKGVVNLGRPHPLTQRIKKLYRERLAKEPDAQLAWRLATIIQNGLRNTDIVWAAPTGGGASQWDREDPAESYATLAEVLELGFRHAEANSELRLKFGISLAKFRLLEGDWDGVNEMLQALGQEPIPKESRQWLPAPPMDWEEGLSLRWKIADESMRLGNCSLEFRIEKDGKGLKGVHLLVKRAPEPTNVGYSGVVVDTLFFQPYPLAWRYSFGYMGNDRMRTRYAVSDESGVVRFDGLPNIPIKIEVLVPTANFAEAASRWELWMEVEPGKFKIAKVYGAPEEVVNVRKPPAVVELREGQTVHYPRLVVRPAFGRPSLKVERLEARATHGTDVQVEVERSDKSSESKSGSNDTLYGSVTGTVRFHGTDAPASGVVVKTVSKWFDTVQARTNQQGSYTLAGIRPEAVFHVSAEDEQKELFVVDMPAVVLKAGEAKTGVDLTVYVGRKGSISGKVVGRRIFYKKPERLTRNIVPENFERRQDTPLSGVKVILKSNKGVLKETITDETGRYRFEGLRADGYTVRVEQPPGAVAETVRTLPMAGPGRAEGHGSSQSRWVELKSEPKTDVDFHFRLDWVSISGRVTDADGNPISGVKVVAELCTPKMDGGEGRSGAFSTIKISWGAVSTISDEDGRYRLDGLCPVTFSETATYLIHGKLYIRRYEIRVQAEGYSPARVLVPPVTEHLAGETSRLMEDYKGLYGERDSSSAEAALPKSRGNAVTGIDFVMEKAAVITGRVLDTQGNVVPGPGQKALVRMVPVDSRDDKNENLLVQMPDRTGLDWIALDEAGRFKFDGVHAGSYFFEIRTSYDTQRARNKTLVVKAGDVIKDLDVIKDIDVIVEPAADRGKISGRVLDARSGKPIEAFSAKVTRVDSSGEGASSLGRTTIDKSQEGAFLIEDISTGTATLEVSAPGYAREKVQVKVVNGQTTDITFNLEQGGKLQVYITLNGKGQMAWVVSARPAGEGPDAELSTQMGKDGRYELTGLKEAEYLVRAPVPLSTGVRGRATVQINNRARVKIEPGKETRLDFELRDNAGIRGTFTCSDKDLSWRILIFDDSAAVRDDSVSEVRRAHALIWKLEQGKHYEIRCLPPGTYRVVGRCCKKDQGWTPVMEKSKTVTLKAKETTEVDFVFP